MFKGQVSGCIIKFTRNTLPGIPFPLNGFNGKKFNEDFVGLCICEGSMQCFDIIGWDEDEVVPVLETRKVEVVFSFA